MIIPLAVGYDNRIRRVFRYRLKAPFACPQRLIRMRKLQGTELLQFGFEHLSYFKLILYALVVIVQFANNSADKNFYQCPCNANAADIESVNPVKPHEQTHTDFDGRTQQPLPICPP